jgi:molybdopterin synthase sulfur carrier subunit
LQVTVRLSGELANQAGRPRFSITLADGATVGQLAEHLRQEYPQASSLLDTAVPVIAGKHVTHNETLINGQEIAFLLPIAGGRF